MNPVASVPTRPPTETSPRRRLAQTDVLIVHPEDPLTVDRLLRRLELLRKRLSVRWCGLDGAFAGYDRLEVMDLSGIVDGPVVLEAVLLDADKSSHVVELLATRPTTDSTAAPDTNARVLLRGMGRTLHTRGPHRPQYH